MPRAARGRGRGRGRGYGCRRGCRTTHERHEVADQVDNVEQDLDISTDVKGFFLGTAKLDAHVRALQENRTRYAAAMCLMTELNMEISLNAKVRALITAFGRNDAELVDALLSVRSLFGLPEVLKAVQALDSKRQTRVFEKKLKRLETQPGKVKKGTLGKIKSAIDNLMANKLVQGSASGAVCRKIAKWVRGYTKDDLEFFAVHMPTDPWKKLADICHFNPELDFPNLPWFLPYCFGENPPPEESLVEGCRKLTSENVNEMVASLDIPFSTLKPFTAHLNLESKGRVAAYTKKLDTLIWYYEDLVCDEVDRIIADRLASGETITLPYGKIMERLLTVKIMSGDTPREFRPVYGEKTHAGNRKVPFYGHLLKQAEEKLRELSLPLEPPILVVGDCSSSMDVAIRTATIIASLITAVTSAELIFFHDAKVKPPFIPKNVEEVLKLALTVRAERSTAPAACLWPLYENKQVVKTIIIVTDEEENTSYKNYMFGPLFKKYHDEVYSAKLVFISFLRGQHATGKMVDSLKREGFEPLQFRLDGSRPDLTKLDTILGSLSTDSQMFEVRLKEVMEGMERNGIKETFLDRCAKHDPLA